MAVKKPGKVLLHHVPLKFVRQKVAGGGRKSVDVSIALIPFIDFLITIVVFLIMSFSASGELVAQKKTITMPDGYNSNELKPAPVISIDPFNVAVDGINVADTPKLVEDETVERIEPLIEYLNTKKENWELLHPNSEEPFPGEVILQAHKDIDFRVIKKVMYSAAIGGHANTRFAVNKKGE